MVSSALPGIGPLTLSQPFCLCSVSPLVDIPARPAVCHGASAHTAASRPRANDCGLSARTPIPLFLELRQCLAAVRRGGPRGSLEPPLGGNLKSAKYTRPGERRSRSCILSQTMNPGPSPHHQPPSRTGRPMRKYAANRRNKPHVLAAGAAAARRATPNLPPGGTHPHPLGKR